MKRFRTKFVVVKDLEDIVKVRNQEYSLYLADVASVLIPVMIEADEIVEVGDCIITEAYLVPYDEEVPGQEIAMRIGDFRTVLKGDFEPMQEFEVELNGLLKKSRKKGLEQVGPKNTFKATATLELTCDFSKPWAMLMLAYADIAKRLSVMESYRFIEVKASLRSGANKRLYLKVRQIELVRGGEK